MSTGIASISLTVVLVAGLVSIGGCDRDVALAPAMQARIDAPQNPSPSVRYRMDQARNRMWVLTPDGVFLYDASTPKTIVEVALPSWQSVDAPYGCLPDLALGPRGEAVVTSNAVPTLWKIDAETLAVSVHDLALDADSHKDIGFSGLAYSAEHKVFFAMSDAHGSLWRIDPLLTKAQKVELSEPIRKACGIVPLRSAQPQRRWLCVRTEEGSRTVILAPDERSGSVKATPCQTPRTHVAREGD